jgi:hypothetical protein
VIGGRVLDASAVIAFASRTSIYAQALVWTAVEEGIVLVVPSTALGKAWAKLTDKDHDVLEVLLRLPVTVVDDLTGTRARAIGELGGDQLDAHALLCACDRGWAVVTGDAARYSVVDGVEIEPLP